MQMRGGLDGSVVQCSVLGLNVSKIWLEFIVEQIQSTAQGQGLEDRCKGSFSGVFNF